MVAIASQITSLAIVYSAVYSDADQRKHESSASLAFVWGIHRDRWIPRTKGQLRGKCFHSMTSSCILKILKVLLFFSHLIMQIMITYWICLCSNSISLTFSSPLIAFQIFPHIARAGSKNPFQVLMLYPVLVKHRAYVHYNSGNGGGGIYQHEDADCIAISGRYHVHAGIRAQLAADMARVDWAYTSCGESWWVGR